MVSEYFKFFFLIFLLIFIPLLYMFNLGIADLITIYVLKRSCDSNKFLSSNKINDVIKNLFYLYIAYFVGNLIMFSVFVIMAISQGMSAMSVI